ncbi:hypothetical protein ANANG_G00073920 [Anguilla anguilla]|uniref:SH3 domain-containing protein n=1 Tax=Anguilla anguilla TaxID=7936 RepID=A0A9D3S828_ANGAN|nr:hypothetical protein ANANG_G00073920 [Anguilla anguilla]
MRNTPTLHNQEDRDVSPAELDALWREPPYTSGGANELFPGNDIMTTDKGEDDQVSDQSVEVEPKPGNYWKEKSAFSRGSTVSLAVGERFSSDVLLVFRGRRRCSGEPDSDLQEALRTRLRVVESNSQDVIQLFKDLSARLLSVHAEKDCFIITFKTVEEIWKFSTYLSLGYVARCLENFLCDQTFWLDSARLSDVEICVTVDEEHLATLYLGLLLQEGSFFAKALYNSRHTEEEDLVFRKDDLVMVRDTGQEAVWEGTLLKSGQHGLVPVLSMQPLPYPFYQWFFRKYPGTACGPRVTKAQFEHPVVTGTCVAVVDHNPLGLDELQFSRGDLIEVVGFLLASLEVFIGRHFSSGQMGFVQKAHMRPENVRPLDGRLVFLSEEERAALSQLNPCNEQYHSGLLSKLSTTDISTVYRLDRLDESDFPYIKNQPKQEPKPPVSARQSVFMEKGDSPPFPSSPRLSEGGWEREEGEACDPTLALLNEDGFRESYRELYDLSYSFLGSAFGGVPEEELLQHLEGVREAAKNRRMPWALRRSCFLLGRLCAKKSKYSQARVYLEEALRVPLPGFRDLPLLIALYTGLTAIYLQQRLEDKLALTLERACALLLGLPGHRFGSAHELELLKLSLRRAVVESDRHLEARSCYLALRLFLELGKVEDALPFVERLQFLSISLAEEEARPLAPVDLNWMLSRLYHRKYLPHMALASLSLDSAPDRSLPDAFQKIEVFIKNSVRLNPQWREGTSLIPAQIVVYLQQALSIASRHGDLGTQRDLCMSLACIYQQHGALEMAVQCAQRAGGHISGTGGHISNGTGGHMRAGRPAHRRRARPGPPLAGAELPGQGRTQDVRLSYETALLIAIGAKNLHSQMVVAKALSHLYCDLLLHGQCIIYYEHCVALSRELKDKRLEGEYLEILSNLYLSLNTEKSSRKSLDYTKQSLRISIDLGKREEESETWLQVGRIYYLIREDELADMYLQAAVKTALRVNDPYFATSIYEEAGDVFFQGHRNRLSALPFYRDGSLPFARSVKDVQSEFRLLSKLTELLTSQEQYEAALQYAVLAVQVSTTTGDRLKERTAFHRLATVYYSLQQFELAENYYLKSLSLSPALLELPSEAQYYVKVYCRLGDLTLHKLKDAFDAVGYLHLALAAALVDQENPRALCRVYRKLAESHPHATHMTAPGAEGRARERGRARPHRGHGRPGAEGRPPPGTGRTGPHQGPKWMGPHQGPKRTGPHQGPNGGAPTRDPNGRAPTRDPSGRAPTRDPSGRAPTRDPNGRAPTGDPSDGPPLAVRPTCAVEEQGDGTGAQNSDLSQPEPKSALSASEDTLQDS